MGTAGLLEDDRNPSKGAEQAQQHASSSHYLLAVVFCVVILLPCGLYEYVPLIGWGQGRVI